ncbi:MAG: hypothetical protein PHQ44_04685 [Anaerovibrio sp.]|nr:hypothetical protein [Anaerovibrio sp.]
MKRGLQLLLMLCVFMLGTQISFAAGLIGGTGVSDERIYDGDSILKVKTLAVADSIYNGPTTAGEPEIDDLPDILMAGTLADKKNVLTYVSYRDVCQNIKMSSHIDILRLERRKAMAEYRSAISSYADAYVVTTVSNGTNMNDGTRLNVFFDVYDARTNKVIYAYRKLAPKSAVRDAVLYTEIARDFFSDFLKVQERVQEDKEKEAKAVLKLEKDAAKKAAKEAKEAKEAERAVQEEQKTAAK